MLVVVAYHYSLQTILQSLTTQTPLAYLGLVPILAILLAVCEIKPRAGEPAIHDRQIDYIIGLPLLVGAVAFNVIGPVRLSTMFWLWRLDIVTLPLFTAGVIALLFGTRVMWRLRVPILFLILAWPLPYSTFLVNWLERVTDTTLAALNVALHVVHVAKALPNRGPGHLSGEPWSHRIPGGHRVGMFRGKRVCRVHAGRGCLSRRGQRRLGSQGPLAGVRTRRRLGVECCQDSYHPRRWPPLG